MAHYRGFEAEARRAATCGHCGAQVRRGDRIEVVVPGGILRCPACCAALAVAQEAPARRREAPAEEVTGVPA